MIKNWRSGNVDGLSRVFLAIWLLGDVTNLVGVVLTLDQHAITQLYIAVYYAIIDSCMLVQFLVYYQAVCFDCKFLIIMYHELITEEEEAGVCVQGVSVGAARATANPRCPVPTKCRCPTWTWPHTQGRTILGTLPHIRFDLNSCCCVLAQDTESIVGYSLGCVSGLLYFTSRIPQIFKNVCVILLKVYSVDSCVHSSGASRRRGWRCPCLSWRLWATSRTRSASCSRSCVSACATLFLHNRVCRASRLLSSSLICRGCWAVLARWCSTLPSLRSFLCTAPTIQLRVCSDLPLGTITQIHTCFRGCGADREQRTAPRR